MMKKDNIIFTSTIICIILTILMVSTIGGCKRKVDVVRERAEVQEVKQQEDSVVWTVRTQYGVYQGHNIDQETGRLEFVTDTGIKIYVHSNWQIETAHN
jgi:hypothetical protein